MSIKTYHYKLSDLNIDAEEIAFPMGYNEGEAPQYIIEMIDKELEELNDVDEICAAVRFFNAEQVEGKIAINGKAFKVGDTVMRFLSKAEQIAVFQCTAGKTISDQGKSLMDNGDVMEGFIVDTIGTVAVEKAMDTIHKELEKDVKQSGLKVTNRYSPGYCDWDVAEQFQLFDLFPENYCGISLTPSALMMPIKSVSGFIGIGKNALFKPYMCDHCTQQECIYSKRKREGQE